MTLYLPGMPADTEMTATGGGGSLTTSDGMLRRSFAGANAGLYRTAYESERVESASFLWVGTLSATFTFNALIFGMSYTNTNTSPYVAIGLRRSTNNLSLRSSNGGAERGLDSTGNLFSAASNAVVVGSVSPGSQFLYALNLTTGILSVTSATIAGAMTSVSGNRIELGDTFNAARNPGAAVEMAVLFNRGLSPAECALLVENPYAAFAPRTARIYSFGQAAAPGGTTIPVFRHHYVQQGIG
jgi:hypothetical protein